MKLEFYSTFFAAFGMGIAFSVFYTMIVEDTLPLSFFGLICAMTGFMLSLINVRGSYHES